MPSEPVWGTRGLAEFPQVEVLPPPAMPGQRVWVHVLLFLLTILTTVAVGGWRFSAGLLSILLAHEFGHYFTARRYRVPASLPYFIPFPISLFGTLGAFIRMSPRIPDRRALFDIAAAGPLAGLVLAIPLSYIGISLSEVVHKDALPGNTISLGEPLLFQYLGWLAHGSIGKDLDLVLHPLAFAGWAGMFVTALNLLPVGQLDGGHISHALFGGKSRWVGLSIFAGLAAYSVVPILAQLLIVALPDWFGGLSRYPFFNQEPSWLFLLVLLWLIGFRHPRTGDDEFPLGSTRQALGALLGLIFALCFSLDPIKF